MMTPSAMEVRPSVSGKVSTALQLSAVSLVLVSLARPGLVHPQINETVFYMTGTVTAAGILQYMYRGLAWFQRQDATAAAARPAPPVASSDPDAGAPDLTWVAHRLGL